jgi:hypothetical protein
MSKIMYAEVLANGPINLDINDVMSPAKKTAITKLTTYANPSRII